jgi:RNA polymerase sigma factor (sigma-70 family)
MTDDAELLRRYAEENSEEAFAEFVRRTINLVYSAALRRTGGDAHTAADVAQQVFISAARHARALARHARLTGWLYSATRNAALNLMRDEQRRQRREQEAHAASELLAPANSPAEWEQLRPVLDAAMDELSDADREAVLLRFFEGRPFAEVAVRLRLTENAARMRVDRALEKLHALLAKRGIASTSAVLGIVLSAEAIIAAPVGLAVSVSSVALTGASAAGGAATLAFMSTTKIIVGTVALAAIGATFYEWNQRQRAEAELAAITIDRDSLRSRLEAEQQRTARSARDIVALEAQNKNTLQATTTTPVSAPPGPSLGRLRTLTELWKGKVLSLQPDLVRGRILTLQVRPLEGTENKLGRDFVDLFGLTSVEQENLQIAVDKARNQIAELERLHATVSANDAGNKLVIAISPFADLGGPISSELMQSFAQILGPERNSAFNALGAADQIERDLGDFGAAERTITISYDASDAASPYSVRNEVKQGSQGTFRTVNRGATLDQATSQIGSLAKLIPSGFGGK